MMPVQSRDGRQVVDENGRPIYYSDGRLFVEFITMIEEDADRVVGGVPLLDLLPAHYRLPPEFSLAAREARLAESRLEQSRAAAKVGGVRRIVRLLFR